MTTKVFVPADSGALSVGAEAVAQALLAQAAARGDDVQIVRNGSRGLYWLEPLIEVQTNDGRVAYGPVAAGDVENLLQAGFLHGADHPLCHGLTEQIPFLAQQDRVTFARVGVIDPLSLDDYLDHGGYLGLQRALDLEPRAIVDAVSQSGLRGRGGAGFPTGIKWNTVREALGESKYIVCNADEGDSGTFADRMLMEGDPFLLIEGMTIAALAVGAERGYIYLRSEYPHAERSLRHAIDVAYDNGYLGDDILGSGQRFDLELCLGAGSYVCGEETALLESLEGKRGTVRFKPPLPALEGLFACPSVVNNVITLATVPAILVQGASAYADRGMAKSRGTMPFQLGGNVRCGGLVEAAFGLSIADLVERFGAGTATGRPIRAIQIGGPLGAYVPVSKLHLALDYETLAEQDAVLGHGGLVVFDTQVDMARMARFAMEFCAVESCGKCTPCRIGSPRGVEVIDRIIAGEDARANEALLRDLCTTMRDGSLCALGGMTHFPVLSALDHFPEDFAAASGT